MVIGVLALAMVFGATAAIMFSGQSLLMGLFLYSAVGVLTSIVLFAGLYFCKAAANRLLRHDRADMEAGTQKAG